MIREAHLESYTIKLKMKSPVFIGSGKEYNKKEYIYNDMTKEVIIVDANRFMNMILQKGLIDDFENFIIRGGTNTLADFVRKSALTPTEIEQITLYKTNVADALREKNTLAGIKCFMRDSVNMPYIPGSSLKGALRTVILNKMIRDGKRYEKIYTYTKVENIESKYLNTLNVVADKGDEKNSIMRGVYISDSEKLSQDDMILCVKGDILTIGKEKHINMIRECIKPDSEVEAVLTIDTSIVKDINIDFIKQAIKEYGEYYKEIYADSFKQNMTAKDEDFENCIVLGGGSGYFSKNIVYTLSRDKSEAVKSVSDIMIYNTKREHHHDKDVELGISPHMLKCTTYENKSYQMGVCEVTIS